MANVPISNMTATWTDSGTTYNAIKMNVTNTASAAASNLLDVGTGGGSYSSQFSVRKDGLVTLPANGTLQNSGISFAGSTANFYSRGAGVFNFGQANTLAVEINYPSVCLSSDYALSWASTSGASGASGAEDLFILRDNAANTLAQRNATNAQTFNVYNTYTNSTNYERFRMSWVSNVLEIGTEAAGTGSTRGIGVAVRDTTNGPLVLRNANTGRNGTLTILANPSSDQFFQVQNGTGTAIIWNGNEINFGSSAGIHFRQRQDTARACWGLNVTFPLSNTSFQFRSAATGDTVLAVQAITSQTGDLQQWVDSAGTALTSVLVDGAIQMKEQTAPAAPAANAVRIYAEDNGSGKTRLMALFATGAAQQIAIEP